MVWESLGYNPVPTSLLLRTPELNLSTSLPAESLNAAEAKVSAMDRSLRESETTLSVATGEAQARAADAETRAAAAAAAVGEAETEHERAVAEANARTDDARRTHEAEAARLAADNERLAAAAAASETTAEEVGVRLVEAEAASAALQAELEGVKTAHDLVSEELANTVEQHKEAVDGHEEAHSKVCVWGGGGGGKGGEGGRGRRDGRGRA